MAGRALTEIPMGDSPAVGDAAVQRPWRSRVKLSSIAAGIEEFLANAGFDRGPWLTVFFAAGIATWFALDNPFQWVCAIAAAFVVITGGRAMWYERPERAEISLALTATALVFAAGLATVWARSEMVGAAAISKPAFTQITARVLSREDQPSKDRVRLVLAMRDSETGRAQKVRVNVPATSDQPALREGAVIKLNARLMPPAPPMVPGAYDFARTAWFLGLSATGSASGEVEIISPPAPSGGIASLQRSISRHVRSQLGGASGTIAAAFASGDRGAISAADEEAMRDSGLTHLLSISGLHVSAVIAATYMLAIRLLALWQWLALRVRLPVAAAAIAALGGIGYTLLTGAEVPTVRSCVGAVLVLIALALGREPLSLRMVAVAALFVLILWPESLVGPSFQLSFSAVLVIIALHNSAPVRAFLAPREESGLARAGRRTVMLLVTGLAIEFALMPIVMFHFHRAGIYGAFANVIAIPLVTFLSMPLIAVALFMDSFGAGAPAWWLAGKSLDLLLAIAHWTASRPGAVRLMPEMGAGLFMAFIAGGLWLVLWKGKIRLLGLVPAGIAALVMMGRPVPDILVSGDGRHVGIAGEAGQMLTLRDSTSSYAQDNLMELAGLPGTPIPLSKWPGARCSPDFCVLTMKREGRIWHVMMAKSRNFVERDALYEACRRSDIVIADRYLPANCHPKWLKADRNMLQRSGGLTIYLGEGRIETVAQRQGEHGWWRGW